MPPPPPCERSPAWEPTVTILPRRRAFITGATAWQARMVPVRLMSSMRLKSAMAISLAREFPRTSAPPALQTRMSTVPRVETISCTMPLTCVSSVTSAWMARARRSRARISSATVSQPGVRGSSYSRFACKFTSFTTTSAPRRARRMA